jgi:hypothetical protein
MALGCSWLCNELETEVGKRGIRVNEHGLFEDFDSSLKFAEWLNTGEIGAEPGLWLPWLLLDYSTAR